ncbi:MAG: secretin and TonB N-terminal domain-containing protein [Candidatus Omnitrophica bacterium]|nr:secretin and TonB N-terminal domain-containing protein [Candidatus Omnitrophota bacterium]
MKKIERFSRKRVILVLLLPVLIINFCISGYVGFAFAEDDSQTELNACGLEKNIESGGDEKLVTINFTETDMREVLNILAYKGGVNIVAGDDVITMVSVQLKDVPWEQALDVILKTYNYTYKKDGNLIRVMSLARALEEEGKIPLVTKIVPLNFANVKELKSSLEKVLSKRGTLEIDERTNSLVITDIPETVNDIERAALELDSRTPQVLIEAMMVDVKITDKDQWGTMLTVLDLKSNNNASNLVTNMPGDQTNTFSFGAVTDALDITSVLDVWIAQQKATILANPKVLTLDNEAAKIAITEEIPYLETVDSGSGTTTNVKFKEAGIKLSVTPHITSGQFISMNVKPEQSFKSGELLGQPLIDKREAETNLLVKDGQTIVIGGLRQFKDNATYEKVPILGDVPFFGLFFRKRVIEQIETELILFVTPHIIRESLLSDRELEFLEMLDNTEKVEIDERTEMQRLKDGTDMLVEKLKALKIEKREVDKRRKNSEQTSGRAERQSLKRKRIEEDVKPVKKVQAEKKRERRGQRQITEKPVDPAVIEEKKVVAEEKAEDEFYFEGTALDYEAAQLKASLEKLKQLEN